MIIYTGSYSQYFIFFVTIDWSYYVSIHLAKTASLMGQLQSCEENYELLIWFLKLYKLRVAVLASCPHLKTILKVQNDYLPEAVFLVMCDPSMNDKL
jgi:hypothetical protein